MATSAILKESEKVIERKLVAQVRNRGGMCIKNQTTYDAGLPDRLVLLPGKFGFFVEVKSTGEKPTKLQNYTIKKLRNMGYTVHVLDSENDITALLDGAKGVENI